MEALYEHHRIVVDKGQQVMRIDKYLVNRLLNVSRSKIQAAAEAGNIMVNDRVVSSNYKVKPQEVISIVLPHPPRETEILPEVEFAQELLLEHNYIILYFDNPLDWEVAKEKFGLKPARSADPAEKCQKIGIGRVLRGADFL